MKLLTLVPTLVILSFFLGLTAPVLIADDDDHENRGGFFSRLFDDDDHHDNDKQGNYRKQTRYLKPVNNPLYKQECGACHFAFQPGLLPAGSWKKLMDNLINHFGDDASWKEGEENLVRQYLIDNSAEHSTAKRAIKILRSLGDETPIRITKTPYIIGKHDDISASTLKRKSIRSLSNCTVCHTTAGKGVYSEQYIRVPK
ncbi:MAG: cytochrome C [SAR324 cluster bacterium]|nr:cytochrome C [SAR324 cluster bacterium]